MTESELETWFASEPDPKTKAMIEFFMNEDTKLHTMDPTLTNSYGQEPLESHGCYNQRIMEHCRPEHDYRIDTSAQCVEKTEENRHVPTTGKNPVVQNPTCRNFRQVQNSLPSSAVPPCAKQIPYVQKNVQNPWYSSVIPWMSP